MRVVRKTGHIIRPERFKGLGPPARPVIPAPADPELERLKRLYLKKPEEKQKSKQALEELYGYISGRYTSGD